MGIQQPTYRSGYIHVDVPYENMNVSFSVYSTTFVPFHVVYTYM